MIEPGGTITFGAYPQTAEGTDTTPIRWRVLEASGAGLFVLSEYILDCRRYYREFADVTWRDSDLRKWLNHEFYETAFSAAEKRLIKTTLRRDNGDRSPDTRDRVFLLSVPESRELTAKPGEDPGRARRRATGTEFSRVEKSDGCRLFVYGGKVRDDYIVEDGEESGCSWWWLRTQPTSPSRAAFAGTRSSIRGYGRVNRTGYGVRPALILDVKR